MSDDVHFPRPETVAADPSPRRLVIAACGVALVVCGLTAYWLWVLLDHRLQFTHRQVTLQTASVAEHASTVFRAADAALLATAADLQRGRIDPGSAAATHATLQLRIGGNGYLIALSLTDADGHVLASSWGDPPPAGRIGAAPGPDDGALRVGPPAPNPFDGRASIELARTVAGAPDGVARVVATVDHAFISGFFERVAYAKDSQVGLFALDGTRLAGALDLARIAQAPPAEVLGALLALGPDASTEHGQVFASAQRLEGLPMVMVSLRDRAAVLAPWHDQLASAFVATAAALVLLTFAVRRLLREMRARLHAQAALARSREEARLAIEATGQRMRRLESLGRLSGGIAHDFNNILAAVVGFGELLQHDLPPGGSAARHLDQVLRAGERGRHLVARILAFSRGSARASLPVAVDAVAGEAIDMLAATLPANVQLERALDAPGALILGDPTQLFEALNNLCTNALHAMPEGGRLTLRSAVQKVDAARALSHGTLARGTHVAVSVGDTGQGMSADVLEHLFEPFFTTRAASGGTGLGLAMVHGAVKEMNGAIDVRSQPGAGACLTLHFPLAEGGATTEPIPPPAALRGGGQVVMVVDDEPALVELTEELLAGLGYEPVGFRDPRQALAALGQTPVRFDALLTDQLMPGLSGTELARAWHALRPEAPILLASGFGGPDLEQQAREAGVSVVLQKPLHRSELATALARVLARA